MNQETIAKLASQDETFQAWGTTYDVAEGPNHQIDTSVTGGAFAAKYYGAWHELGQVSMDPNLSAAALLTLAGADYPILRAPLTTRVQVPISPGSPLKVWKEAEDPRRANICRLQPETGALEILGQASKNYPLWNNHDVFVGFGDAIMDMGHPTCSTAGALDGGRQAFMGFELPREVKVGGMDDERVRLWLVLHTSYDSSKPTTATVTPIRPVCANTIRAGKLKALSSFTIKKTKNADLKVAQARQALNLVPAYMEEFQAQADALITTTVTNDQFRKVITEGWGPDDDASKAAKTIWEKTEAQLMELFAAAPTQENARRTAYAAVQAVTEFADWNMKVTEKPYTSETGYRLFRSAIDPERSVNEKKDYITNRMLELAGV